jgi:hypothetical protein
MFTGTMANSVLTDDVFRQMLGNIQYLLEPHIVYKVSEFLPEPGKAIIIDVPKTSFIHYGELQYLAVIHPDDEATFLDECTKQKVKAITMVEWNKLEREAFVRGKP